MNETYKNIEKLTPAKDREQENYWDSIREQELKEYLKTIAEHAGYFPELCEIKKEEWFGEIMKILSK